jgi:hypothetical protein
MMAPAARAALMATLSMGWRLDDINCVKNEVGLRTIAAAKGAFSHEKGCKCCAHVTCVCRVCGLQSARFF